MKALLHPREDERLAALFACQILDTKPEDEFDDIVKLAATVCGTPASTITFVDSKRQWFKAATGMPSEVAPLELAICAHTLLSTELVEIPDTRLDLRTSDNPLCASEGGCRFYAGAPLLDAKGLPLGTLCVLGFVPQVLTEVQRHTLKVLAQHVVKLLELRIERRASEMLRFEVDHRVKNSLASLAALIRIEKRKATKEETMSALQIVSRQIEIAAAVHEAMYRTESGTAISLKSLLEQVGALIEESLPNHIALKIAVEDAMVPDVSASKIAIVVNEIITNATKHAFPVGQSGEINIVGQNKDNRAYVLTAQDNGVGDGASPNRANVGIGKRIMEAAVAHISGQLIQTDAKTGMGWQFSFPLKPQTRSGEA